MRIVSWERGITVPEEGTTIMLEQDDRHGTVDVVLYRPELPMDGVVVETYEDMECAERALEHFFEAVERKWLFFQFPDNDDVRLAVERKKKNGGV